MIIDDEREGSGSFDENYHIVISIIAPRYAKVTLSKTLIIFIAGSAY
jgi:hypothetical protein